MAQPSFTQVSFRIRNDDGTEITATWKEIQGDDSTIDVDTNFRVRFLIDEGNSKAWTTDNFQVYYSHNSGTYAVVTNATPVQYSLSDHFANGEDCVSRLTGGSGGSFVTNNNGMLESSATANNSGSIDDYFEMEICLTIDSAQVDDEDTIELRIYEGSAAIASYTDHPLIIVNEAAAPINVDLATASLTASGQVIAVDPGGVAPTNVDLSTATLTAARQSIFLESQKGILVDVDHEEGTTADYDSVVGTPSVNTASRMTGHYGMECIASSAQAHYGEIDFSHSSNTIRYRVYIDPHTLTMVNLDTFTVLMLALDGSYAGRTAFGYIRLRYESGSYAFTVQYYQDNGLSNGFHVVTSDAPKYVEVVYVRESYEGAADGTMTAYLDGVYKDARSTIENYNIFRTIDKVQLGAVEGVDAGTSGTIYVDDLLINDTGIEIGPPDQSMSLAVASLAASGQTLDVVTGSVSIALATALLTAGGQVITIDDGASVGIVVDINHEDGTTDEWDTLFSTPVVNTAARMTGHYGLELDAVFGTPEYCLKSFTIGTNYIRFRFYFDPSGLTMGLVDAFHLVHIEADGTWNSQTDFTQNRFRWSDGAGAYQVNNAMWDDVDQVHAAANHNLLDGPNYIECLYARETYDGGEDGYSTMWINGVHQETRSSIANYNFFRTVKEIKVGVIIDHDVGTSGSLYIDDLIINDTGDEIGPPDQSMSLATALLTAAGITIAVDPGAGGGINVTLDTAGLIAGGQAIGFTMGAVSKLLATASLTAGGQVLGIVPGAVSKLLATANLIAEGQVAGLTMGAVSKLLATAGLTATGQILGIVPGAVSKELNTANLIASGQTINVVPGSVSIALATAIATATGQVITIDPGGGVVQIDLNTAALVAVGQALTISPGAVATTLATAITNATGQPTTVIPGSVSTALATAGINANGQIVGIVPGAVSIGLTTAITTASGQTITIDIGLIVSLNTAALIASGQTASIIPGAVAISIQSASITANGQAVGLTLGAVEIALATALSNAVGQALAVVPGAANVTLSTALVNASGQNIYITIGYNIELDTATITANGQIVAIVPGAVSAALNTASIVANGIPITIVPGAIAVALSTAVALVGGQAIEVLPGVYVVSLGTAQIQADGQQIGLVPGAASVILSTAALLANGQGISVEALGIITAIVKEWTLNARDQDLSLDGNRDDVDMNIFERTFSWSLEDDDR